MRPVVNIFDRFVKEANLKHNNKYTYPEGQFVKSTKDKADIICPEHGNFRQPFEKHVRRGQGCPKCKLKLISSRLRDFYKINKRDINKLYSYKTKTPEELMEDLNKANDYKYTYDFKSLENVKNSGSKITINCKKHGKFEKKIRYHMLKKGCDLCRVEKTSKQEGKRFIERSKEIFKDALKYDKVNYISNKIDVILKCKQHGYFRVRPDNHIGLKQGCPICSSSLGEVKIFNILLKLDINFIKEYNIPGYNYKYDYYLPDLNIIIEYDGMQHYQETDYGIYNVKEHGVEAKALNLRHVQKIDEIKNNIAISNNITIERISYLMFDYLDVIIPKIINKKFKYIYNGKFYKNFLDLCRKNNFPEKTKIKECEKYDSFIVLSKKLKENENANLISKNVINRIE